RIRSKPAVIAHPVTIDIRIIARLQTLDLIIPNAHANAAITRASIAHAIRKRHIPHARLESEITARERTDRADVDHIHRHIIIETLGGDSVDGHMIAALRECKHGLLGNFSRKANTARAGNAALAIEEHIRTKRDALILLNFLLY